MGDSVQIPWELANRSVNPMDAAAAGLAQGQRVGALNALHGLDLDNPDSLNRSLQNSARVGALDQANALMNLSFIRNLRSSLPSLTGMVSALGNTSQPAAAAAAPPSPTPAAAPQTANLNGYQDNLKAASGAIDSLLQTPQAERPAKLAAIKQDFLSRGVPEQAIDAAVGSDLSDAHLESLKAHFGDHADYAGSVANPAEGAITPAMPAAHPSNYGWSDTLLQHPELQATLSMYKAAGIDFTPLIETARTLQAPQIAEQAKAQYAQQIQLAQNVANLITGPTRLQQEATGAGQKSLQEKLVALGFDPEIARRTTAAQEAARAPYNPVSIPTPTGAPAVESSAEFAAQHGGPATAGGMGPQVGAAPATVAAGTVSGQQNAQQAVALQSRAADVPTRKAALENLRMLAPEFAAGPQSGFWKGVGGIAAEYGIHVPNPNLAPNAISAQEEFDKISIGVLAAQRQAMGLPVTDASTSLTSGAVPNERLTPKGIQRVTGMMEGNEDYIGGQNQAWQTWSQSGHGGETFGAFQAQFNRLFDPRVFQAQYMSPDQRGRVRQSVGPKTFDRQEAAAKKLGYISSAE